MTTARAKHGSFLFKRPGSDNWWIRLRSPGKKVVVSLKTDNRAVAELAALPMIQEHKARLLAARPRIELAWRNDHQPGAHTLPDGRRIFATDRVVHYLDDAGSIIDTAPNGAPEHRVTNLEQRLGIPYAPVEINENVRTRTVEIETEDDKLFKTYLDFGGKQSSGLKGYYRREAEAVWAIFKQLTAGKPLAKCNRDDGRLLLAHFREQGLSQASVKKKIMWLTAFANMAIKDGRLTNANPFSGLVGKPKKTPEDRRFNLDDADIKLCRANLGALSNPPPPRARKRAIVVVGEDKEEI
jgi:hypothetical protein